MAPDGPGERADGDVNSEGVRVRGERAEEAAAALAPIVGGRFGEKQ